MLYLLINTCGEQGIVALADEAEGVLAEERLPLRGTSEHLMPAIRRVLGAVRVGELGGVGVVIGPGSFTGVRVGLAAAKGLCEAGGVGMVAMSRLTLVAGPGGTAVLDGGRGEFFFGDGKGEQLLRKDELPAEVRMVTCEARLVDALGGFDVGLVGEPDGAAMLAMVLERVRAAEWSDVGVTDANYLRRTDAELKVGI